MSDLNKIHREFVFSTLLPAPKITFQYDNPHAHEYYREPSTKEVRMTIQSDHNESIQIELTKGVLTLQYCDQLLNCLLRNPHLKPFKQKVDPEKEGVPDYYKIIKNPMDLSLLKERLYTGLITSVQQFKQELDLIWENCFTYNGADSKYAKLAKQVKIIVDKVWSESTIPAPSNALDQLKKLDDVLEKLDQKTSNLLRIGPRPQIQPAKTPKPSPKPVEPAPPPPQKVAEAPPNRQQRKLIAEKLSKSPVSEMRKAWNILKPHLTKEIQERPYLSLDTLPTEVLIELKKAVLP